MAWLIIAIRPNFHRVLFLLIRPQQKRAKEHRQMVESVSKGDKIVTSGGITGTVTKSVAEQDTVEVEIAKDARKCDAFNDC